MALKRWIGAAAAVSQVTKVTFSAYSSAQTYSLTINGKVVSFLSVTGTNSEIWAGLVAAWEASAEPEILEALATVSTGVVLTSREGGNPFTVSAGATTGTPTVTLITAATGPNYFSNDDNWEGGAAPAAADDLLFAESDVDLLHDLTPGFALGVITVEKSFTGRIGLGRVASGGYQEYRPRYLTLGDAASIIIGAGTGNGSNRILIDAATEVVDVEIYGTGQGEGYDKAVRIVNADDASTFAAYAGSFELSGTGGAASIDVISRQDTGSAPEVIVKGGAVAGVVRVSGANARIILDGNATSIEAMQGGQVTVSSAGTCPTVSASGGGVVYWDSSGAISTQLFVYSGGSAMFGRRAVARTVADCELHGGGTLDDPFGLVTWTAGVTLVGLLSEVELNLGRNVTLTI